jgi:uncharacterized membrane protein
MLRWDDGNGATGSAKGFVIGPFWSGVGGGGVRIDSTGITSPFYYSSSDYRIKENIKFIDLSEYNIDKLTPIIYDHKGSKQTNIGFLAHEVQEHFPFLVSGVKDGEKTQSISYTGLIGLLTKEIQELKKRVSQLEKN